MTDHSREFHGQMIPWIYLLTAHIQVFTGVSTGTGMNDFAQEFKSIPTYNKCLHANTETSYRTQKKTWRWCQWQCFQRTLYPLSSIRENGFTNLYTTQYFVPNHWKLRTYAKMKHRWISYIPSPNSSLMISLMLSPKCMTASFNLCAICSNIVSKNTILISDKLLIKWMEEITSHGLKKLWI